MNPISVSIHTMEALCFLLSSVSSPAFCNAHQQQNEIFQRQHDYQPNLRHHMQHQHHYELMQVMILEKTSMPPLDMLAKRVKTTARGQRLLKLQECEYNHVQIFRLGVLEDACKTDANGRAIFGGGIENPDLVAEMGIASSTS